MSLWTHVCGCIRVDQLDSNGLKFKDTLAEKFKDPPSGSEGPLEVLIATSHESGSSNTGPGGAWETVAYQWAVTITGDLRDYGHTKKDVEAICKWLKTATKDLYIRNGIVEIEVEGANKYILQHTSNWLDKRKRQWMLL